MTLRIGCSKFKIVLSNFHFIVNLIELMLQKVLNLQMTFYRISKISFETQSVRCWVLIFERSLCEHFVDPNLWILICDLKSLLNKKIDLIWINNGKYLNNHI